jgi:hypothetical protein
VYVGSAEDEKYDQTLESVLVGPVNMGSFRFVFQVSAACASDSGSVALVTKGSLAPNSRISSQSAVRWENKVTEFRCLKKSASILRGIGLRPKSRFMREAGVFSLTASRYLHSERTVR